MDAQKVISYLNLDDNLVLNIYMYGSRVYGCNLNGDYDFIIVVKGENIKTELRTEEIDATIYSEDLFQELIDNHEISALECIFLPDEMKLLETKSFNFNLNIDTLRTAISQKSDNSFVKAKKKLIVEKDFDPYIAKKSLFHSLRILLFGLQIAKYDKIVWYGIANPLWDEIMSNPSEDWEDYKKIYKPLFNEIKGQFRIYAPKTVKCEKSRI